MVGKSLLTLLNSLSPSGGLVRNSSDNSVGSQECFLVCLSVTLFDCLSCLLLHSLGLSSVLLPPSKLLSSQLQESSKVPPAMLSASLSSLDSFDLPLEVLDLEDTVITVNNSVNLEDWSLALRPKLVGTGVSELKISEGELPVALVDVEVIDASTLPLDAWAGGQSVLW